MQKGIYCTVKGHLSHRKRASFASLFEAYRQTVDNQRFMLLLQADGLNPCLWPSAQRFNILLRLAAVAGYRFFGSRKISNFATQITKDIDMKRNSFLAKVLLVAAAFACLGLQQGTAAGLDRPKLVVGIVVDQMRWDYLYRYYNLYGEGGFRRLMAEGYNCENTMINYVPTITAVGHASIFTGSVPAIHGIAGNDFMMDGRMVYCCADSTVSGVGSDTDAGRMSPRNLLTTTIGDELKIATDFKAKVVGVSLKDRASILPAGHAADGAYWMDNATGRFITSTYYMERLPQWVADFNERYGGKSERETGYSPYGNLVTAEMAKAAVEGEALGQDSVTDMLTVSFSVTDKVGHEYATHSPEIQEIFIDLDRRLADLFGYLDNKVGKGRYLVFLTADHGAANNAKMLRDNGIPAGGFVASRVANELDGYLKGRFGVQRSLVATINNYKVFIDHKAVSELSLQLDDVKKAAVDWLKRDPQYAYVVDLEHAMDATLPAPVRERLVNGYHRLRSGDIQLVLNPAHYETGTDEIGRGTTHGVWNPYDSHIPFILMGWHVSPGSTNAPTTINDIAATVCALIHVQMPNGCIGNAVIN